MQSTINGINQIVKTALQFIQQIIIFFHYFFVPTIYKLKLNIAINTKQSTMVSSHYLFLFTLISLTFLSLDPTAAKSSDLINDICFKAEDASHCLEFLKPLYRPGESVLDLTRDTVQSSAKFLFLVYDEIHVREIQTIRDPILNRIYHKCGVDYTAATNSLIKAQQIVQSGADYHELLSLASDAVTQSQSCDKNFTPAQPEPSDFLSLSKKAQNVCSIVLALSNILVSGK